MRDAEILKKGQKPSELTSCYRHCSIFSFSRGMRNYYLFLRPPRNQGIPQKIQKPMRDLLVSGQPAQSESQKPFKFKALLEGKNNP
jgi:hypothetical protein